jgi:hypothetical protein
MLLPAVLAMEAASCSQFENLCLMTLPFADLVLSKPVRWNKAVSMASRIQNVDRPYRLLSASARAPPGTWLYPPDSTSEPLAGMRWNFVASMCVVLASTEIGLLGPD